MNVLRELDGNWNLSVFTLGKWDISQLEWDLVMEWEK